MNDDVEGQNMALPKWGVEKRGKDVSRQGVCLMQMPSLYMKLKNWFP